MSKRGSSLAGTEMSRRELFSMAVPKGILPQKGHLTIETLRCTGCTLCAAECMTGALYTEGEGRMRLLFRHELCDSCGACANICPESCIKLEKGPGNSSPLLVFEDEYARCVNCGAVIGSKAMIQRIKEKLEKHDKAILGKLELCSRCKGMRTESAPVNSMQI
jgi:ferredoxin